MAITRTIFSVVMGNHLFSFVGSFIDDSGMVTVTIGNCVVSIGQENIAMYIHIIWTVCPSGCS